MHPIRVILASDDGETVEKIKGILEGLEEFHLIGQCENGEQLVDEVMVHKPELVLSSIHLDKKNGLQAIKECRAFFPALRYIFITRSMEYAIEAFEISAVDYVVKPFENRRLLDALERAKLRIWFEQGLLGGMKEPQTKHKLPIKDANGTLFIPHEVIYFLEKTGKKCLVYTDHGIYDTNETMGTMASRLGEPFYQAHRSYIINLKKISQITPKKESFIVQFQGFDKVAKISKLKINEVREWMLRISQE